MPGGAPIGNKNSAKGRPITNAMLREAAQNPDRLRRIIEKLFGLAEEGDLKAVEIIFDRLDGKPRQAVELSGDEDNPVMVTGMIKLVRPVGTSES